MAINDVIVIKFGGEITDTPSDLSNLLDSVKILHEKGQRVVLVHGGGPRANHISKEFGITPIKVGGRRVTDRETLDVVKMVLPGIINSDILAMAKSKSIPAVSLSGISLFTAKKRPPLVVSGSNGEKIDFGYVGDIHGVNEDILSTLLSNNLIPVISPLCSDDSGVQLNINADTVACSLAYYIKAKGLTLITKVGGVFRDINDSDSLIHSLNINEAKQCIQDGVIQGGMIPKIEETFRLLENGLERVYVVGTTTDKTLLNAIENPGSEGTYIY
jgi:acetylglutamate kinase